VVPERLQQKVAKMVELIQELAVLVAEMEAQRLLLVVVVAKRERL
jgi:hypothetical protein